MSSDYLTVGTGDSNHQAGPKRGLPAPGRGARHPATPADEADVALEFFSDDIFTKALADYTGELRAKVTLQITDKDNTPHPGGPGAATTTQVPLELTVGCTPVADPQEGSSCTRQHLRRRACPRHRQGRPARDLGARPRRGLRRRRGRRRPDPRGRHAVRDAGVVRSVAFWRREQLIFGGLTAGSMGRFASGHQGYSPGRACKWRIL